MWPPNTTGTKKVKVTVTDRNKHDEDKKATAEATVRFAASSDAARGGGGSEFAFEVPLGGEAHFVWGGDGAVTARSEDAKVVAVGVSSPVVRVAGVGIGETHVVMVTKEGELWLPVVVR